MLLEGVQLGHRYNLRTLIGRGMGEVYLAEDTRINNRQVAVKVARSDAVSYPDADATKDATRLFQREVTAIGMLNHPNILPLFDSGEDTVSGMPVTYLVMPYCPDGSLATWLRQRTGSSLLSPQDVAYIVNQAADALQYAHDRQIIHRDVKPSNFLIRSNPGNPGRPNVLLTDFGIAKFIATTVSASQTVRGTPTYMAPEQWTGQPVPATDQYALAAMAYELLTGRPIFQAPMEQMFFLHLSAQPQPPSSINPRLPRALDAVILRALAKSPQDRFPSITAFAQAFQQAALTEAAPMPMPVATPTPPPPPPNVPPTGPMPPRGNDISIPLTLSREEAMTGSNRILPLAGGRQVPVFLPAGAYNGQVLRLQGQGERSPFGGLPGDLILTLTVPNVQSQTTTIPGNPPGSVFSPVRVIVLIGLVLLVILASAGGFFVIRNNQIATDNANATATARANATGTTQASNATATVQAANATSTAIAQETATAVAQVNATATVVAANPYPSYLPGSGTLALYDPLDGGNSTYGWETGNECSFTSGAYHISSSQKGYFTYCTARSTHFDNFAFEVKMMFIKGSQDCGGMLFRADTGQSKFYYFAICQDGFYELITYVDNSGSHAKTLIDFTPDPAINTGLNAANVITVMADGGSISLYVNSEKIDSVQDSTYTQGQISLFADAYHDATEAVFSNAKVWTF